MKERLVTCNEEDTDGQDSFVVKTQLTERSRITDKHRENHIKKHHEH